MAGLLGQAARLSAQAPGAPAQAPGAPPVAVSGAPMVLSFDEAVALGEARSELVAIAEAGVVRAGAQEQRARSERFPQLFAAASYDRALASEFSGLFSGASPTPSCEPLQVNPQASLDARVAELERAYDCQSSTTLFGGDDLGNLPFGRKNTYRVNLSFSQSLFTGGRVAAQERQARLGSETAGDTLTSARAQLILDVARAYLDAALSDRIVEIAEANYDQANRAFTQTRAQREVGRVAEFELLRAQVARDTLRPEVIRQRAARDVAYLQLKQLLEIPPSTGVHLSAELNADVPITQRYAALLAEAEAGGTTRERVAVLQAERTVAIQKAAVTIARSQRLPSIALNSGYGLVAYPSNLPIFGDWRTNWTVGASVQVPVLTGGRLRAEEVIAQADVDEATVRVRQVRELAVLDIESAQAELAAARAAWEASGGTVTQAQRAFEIAELRYREGISTQLELSDARLLLQQAEVNRAQAARDLQLSRIRLALLPDLPLATAGSAGAVATSQRAVAVLGATRATDATSGAQAFPTIMSGGAQPR